MAQRFTKRFIEDIGTDGTRAEYKDTAVSGFVLRVGATGKKTWALRYRRQSDGQKRTVTLGAFPDHSLAEARDWAEDKKREIARGEAPAAKRAARKAAPTFAELAAEWVEGHGKPNVSARVLADYQGMLKRHIEPEIGTMKAAEVKKRDIVALLGAVKAKGDARVGKRPGTKAKKRRKPVAPEAKKPAAMRRMSHRPNRVFELVRSIFRWGVSQDILHVEPTLGVKPPIKKEAPRERVLAPSELRALWVALEAAPVERRQKRDVESGKFYKVVSANEINMTRTTALAIQVAAVTAQRIGEVAGMAVAELDLNDTAPVWCIPGSRTKNGLPHRVPLSALAVKLIKQAIAVSGYLQGGSPWVFAEPNAPKPGEDPKHINPGAATKALERSRGALGLEKFRIHDLRRTAATGMAELGVNPYTVSLVLNHESVRRGTITGRVYDQYGYDREKREALDKWGARVEAILDCRDGANVVAFAVAKASKPAAPSL